MASIHQPFSNLLIDFYFIQDTKYKKGVRPILANGRILLVFFLRTEYLLSL